MTGCSSWVSAHRRPVGFVVSDWKCSVVVAFTYKESSGNKDQDTTSVVGGLGVQAGDLVLDLLERQGLCNCSVSVSCMLEDQGLRHTTSFSVMPAAP